MLAGFNARKAAQVAAFFAREQGGSINVLKLTKLVYLADRGCLESYDFTITGDVLVSMPQGPVNSTTYDLISGAEQQAEWDALISDKENHRVALAREAPDEDLTELSEVELDILNQTWGAFGHMDQWQLRDYTHKGGCPEWEDPHGSSSHIPYSRILRFFGRDNAEQLDRALRDERRMKATLASA